MKLKLMSSTACQEQDNYQILGTGTKHLDILYTRSYAALRAADLEWIVGPGYILGGYILEKNHEKPTWNHEKP